MAGTQRNGFIAFIVLIFRGLNLFRLLILNVIFFGLLLLLFSVLSGSNKPEVKRDSVLVLQPQGQLVEQYSVAPLERMLAGLSGDPIGQVQVRDLVAAIDHARTDSRITRIVLLPGELRAGGFAALREVGAALDRFRASGKPVDVWAPSMDRSQYYLAAHGSKVLLDPMGGLLITGLSSYRLFYKDLLDKLGVDVHLFRVGQFKSAAEPYVLDQASPQAKEADAYWMGGLWKQWLNDVAKQRKLNPDALRQSVDSVTDRLAAAGGDLGKLAVEDHLVDGLATRRDLVMMLRKDGVPAGAKGQGIREIDMKDYLRAVSGPVSSSRDHVAVIVAEGEIVGGKQRPGKIGGASTAQQLYRARMDGHVRAVVLRVDSPGGEVYAAERIRRQVALLRADGKPVVVSMGDVAASGGYWISMNADRIFAEPNTITGSIGIFGMVYNVPGLLNKIGVHNDGVGVGPLAGAGDITRPLNPQMAQLMQGVIDKGYRDFVGGVAKARGKTFKQIDAIAQGRVWTGTQALQRGLVDQLGGVRDAIAYAAKKAGLKSSAVRYMAPPGSSGLKRLMTGFGDSAAAHALASLGLQPPAWLREMRERIPGWTLLQHAKPGKLNVYADCLCAPR
ncbi:signal peptide peptidase SppA [Oleiagrimonas sp. MCCC 1A03011]|uniref:signal peptide peptidase SppA n=1 Tax=Oleiagrimonas sp. MCCC 1A03011 TaxID=1926883 RepID=UPI000DC3CB38|nr:signal peptide peptidase SppA [Oleiagrimonas sp. MCCC 1A03011]RAP58277.1 signal peptide peptidase SppA [Oleiagrimonas sp. MCCC 1A03011]